MASEIKIIRLSTGEDVIGKVDEGSGETVELKNPFRYYSATINTGPPIQLMMSLYNAYGKKDTITMNKDKIVFMSVPKDEILKSYEQNTSRILTPKSSLITETNIPTLKK